MGASLPPTSAVLKTENNYYTNAGFNIYTLVVTESTVKDDFELVYDRCAARGISMRIRLHGGFLKEEYTEDYNAFTEIFPDIDFSQYPLLQGFFIADEPSWFGLQCIKNSYAPWFNKYYADSNLEFFVNLLSGYSTGMGPLRNAEGELITNNGTYRNTSGLYDGENAYSVETGALVKVSLTEEEKETFTTAYHNEWLTIFEGVKSANKHFSHDSYPLLDNQTGWRTDSDGEYEWPEEYERYLYDEWLARTLNMATIAKQNGHKFGAYIQAFDQGDETYPTAEYRLPTKLEEIKWQVYMNIAFGAKRLCYFGYSAHVDGTYMVDSNGEPLHLYSLVKEMNEELNKVDHVFATFETWVGVKTFTPANKEVCTAFEKIATKELAALTGVLSVSTDRELVVGEMVDGNDNHGYMLVGYDDPYNGNSTNVEMTFDGADGFIIYRNGERTLSECTDGKLSVSLAAGEGVFVIPVYVGTNAE
ncbi:MAG: hypothetical protein IJ506_08420 [Clostridia bacterium]|nr:hypothetical protein [Clostridia bacterium]